MSMTVGQAESALADFQARREAHVERFGKMREQKTKIAPDALSGNAAKKAKLDKLNRDIAAAALELEDFDAAITAASRDLDQARRDRDWKDLCAKADAGLALLPAVRERAAKINAALDTFLSELESLGGDIQELQRAGAMIPHSNLRRVSIKNAIASKLGAANLAPVTVPPSQRRRIEDVIGSWINSAERSLERVKNPNLAEPEQVAGEQTAEIVQLVEDAPSQDDAADSDGLENGFRGSVEEWDRKFGVA